MWADSISRWSIFQKRSIHDSEWRQKQVICWQSFCIKKHEVMLACSICRENLRSGVCDPLQGWLYHGVSHQLWLLRWGKNSWFHTETLPEYMTAVLIVFFCLMIFPKISHIQRRLSYSLFTCVVSFVGTYLWYVHVKNELTRSMNREKNAVCRGFLFFFTCSRFSPVKSPRKFIDYLYGIIHSFIHSLIRNLILHGKVLTRVADCFMGIGI